ncbi:hypothetical protein Arnit_1235 [Arcobacter nitrofigilis DSM 7299]|uniref:Uncharacterized protein n=1 Tax=Arcobacter nitrofigilis (strain ATCC 33309 / DSM 7299 / CCUG 15893 / LMG 7604 / NCTC 12251 / CI) TaxID=572480 RepID=D5V4I9_ARCNC|nr:hypothetical protein [Arcobacter nitrofigilis]ADG92894.1 hypothetical protein Arnit_1235 [Arcobacter nitrofigilis DSM 7299]
MKRKYEKPCYYCGEKAEENEHAPPKQMFKAFSCDSITVPACKKHNSCKGGSDQAIVSSFLVPLYNGREKYNLEPEILKAIEQAKSAFIRTKRRAIDSPLFNDTPEEFKDLPNLAYIVPEMDIKSWVRQLTAALVCDAIQDIDYTIKWEDAMSWSPDFIEASKPESLRFENGVSILRKNYNIKLRLEQLVWINGWSAHPRAYPKIIYYFQLYFKPTEIVFRHKFYNQYTWYVWFSASQQTISKLKDKISSQNAC